MNERHLGYIPPFRPLVYAWLILALVMIPIGIWAYSLIVVAVLFFLVCVWINIYTTILHYAFDAQEFTKLPIVGEPIFVEFQSHHYPPKINTIYQKPIVDLLGELNTIALASLLIPVLAFGLPTLEILVAWGALMLAGCYVQLCHRWAHQPARTRPLIAKALQRAHLALSPTEHWRHHAHSTFGLNFDVSFGWSNTFFNLIFKLMPSPRLWLLVFFVTTATQVWCFAILVRWLAA